MTNRTGQLLKNHCYGGTEYRQAQLWLWQVGRVLERVVCLIEASRMWRDRLALDQPREEMRAFALVALLSKTRLEGFAPVDYNLAVKEVITEGSNGLSIRELLHKARILAHEVLPDEARQALDRAFARLKTAGGPLTLDELDKLLYLTYRDVMEVLGDLKDEWEFDRAW